jgi:hypothetical protein
MFVYVRICYANVHYVVRIGYGRSQFVKFDFSVTTTSLRLCSSHLDSYFTAEHVLTRMIRSSNAL